MLILVRNYVKLSRFWSVVKIILPLTHQKTCLTSSDRYGAVQPNGILLSKILHRPLKLRLGIDQKIRAGDDTFPLLQPAGDLIIAFPVWAGGVDKLSADLDEARLQFARPFVYKYQHTRSGGENCIKWDCESFSDINLRADIGIHARAQLAIGVRNIDADRR